ncbi:MAG: 3-phosphoshikimate 1-carboxyvinyltransferase [Bacteroidaceae bacterium]|nr:3-phosphoshikimate 1-carboxyvinyltransferase [Bacteroidaceae bacterium]
MQIQIKAPDGIGGQVFLPASKSISNRALILNTLAGNKDLPVNVSDCDDTNVMLHWLEHRPETVDIGAAGTAMRFSTALLAVSDGVHTITGTERMRNRPIAVLVDALRTLGADIEYVEREGYPPLKITGNKRLAGGEITLRGNVSSQYISALLMIAPTLKKGLRLNLTDEIVSRPYINMTLAMMREFGAEADWLSDRVIAVQPGAYQSNRYVVENDWSAASYWYEMLALAPQADTSFVLPGLFAQSLQGDSREAEVFENLGVHTEYCEYEHKVSITKTHEVVKHLDYDFVEMPDLAQTFVVTCCMMGVPFHFTGLQSLKIKETDRIAALKAELAKLGFLLEDRNDSELLWTGQRTVMQPNVSIDTYEDHRMAMAFAPAALRLGEIRINHPEVVTKSYPHYWEDLQSVGFLLEKL